MQGMACLKPLCSCWPGSQDWRSLLNPGRGILGGLMELHTSPVQVQWRTRNLGGPAPHPPRVFSRACSCVVFSAHGVVLGILFPQCLLFISNVLQAFLFTVVEKIACQLTPPGNYWVKRTFRLSWNLDFPILLLFPNFFFISNSLPSRKTCRRTYQPQCKCISPTQT